MEVLESGNEAELLVELLRSAGLKLAVAESLTGGLLSSAIVDVPGASDVFLGGVVSYATAVKSELLGVQESTLRRGGPVQEDVATQMAQGVSKLLGADLALSTTGVAGPGDSPDGPCGLVYIGATLKGSQSSEATVEKYLLSGTRDSVRDQVVTLALLLALKTLQGVL